MADSTENEVGNISDVEIVEDAPAATAPAPAAGAKQPSTKKTPPVQSKLWKLLDPQWSADVKDYKCKLCTKTYTFVRAGNYAPFDNHVFKDHKINVRALETLDDVDAVIASHAAPLRQQTFAESVWNVKASTRSRDDLAKQYSDFVSFTIRYSLRCRHSAVGAQGARHVPVAMLSALRSTGYRPRRVSISVLAQASPSSSPASGGRVARAQRHSLVVVRRVAGACLQVTRRTGGA